MGGSAASQVSLRTLWAARSVAIVGASTKPDSPGSLAVQYLNRYGYAGRILPIHPSAPEIAGRPAYPTVVAAGGAESALILTPAPGVREAIKDCAAAGVRVAIVGSSGFAETGPDGRALQDALVAQARAGGVRLVGPNCIGAVGFATGQVASFSPLFSGPATTLVPGGIGFASASGALGYGAVSLALQRGIGLLAAITTGNEADVTTLEALVALAGEPECTGLLGYLESLDDPAALRALAATGKPVALLVAGVSAAGARAVASHTGALTTPARVVDGALRQLGIVSAGDIDELLDYGEAFATTAVAPGRVAGTVEVPDGGAPRVAVVTTSGGSGILAADAIAAHGLRLAQLGDDTLAELSTIVPAYGAVANPVDVTATVMRDRTLVRRTLDAVAADGNVDVIVLCFCVLVGEDVDAIVEAVASVSGRTPVLAARTGADHLAPDAAAALRAAGVATFPTPARAVRAVAALWRAGAGRGAAAANAGAQLDLAMAPPSGDEDAVKGWLEAAGVPVPRGRVITTAADATDAVLDCGGLAVLKVVAPGLVHKTEAGGVALGVTPRTAQETAARLAGLPGAVGVLIEEQCEPGIELLVGVAPTPLGPALTLGAGGVHTEVLDDVSTRLLPVTGADVREQLAELRIARLFPAHRGRPGTDVDALVDLVMRVAGLAAGLPEGAALDLNPVVVGPRGAVVLDAAYLDPAQETGAAGAATAGQPVTVEKGR